MDAKISAFGGRKEFQIVLSPDFGDALKENIRTFHHAEEIVPEIILHQYVNSPFSEKIRKIFAHKNISWRSVEQPVIMPKPKLVPLTGGYRRIPVMQIGADVWCDSNIILKQVEAMFPEPTIFPDGQQAAADLMNQWADRGLFWSTTPVIFEKLSATIGKEFIEDRSKMMRGTNFADITLMAPDARNQLRAFLDILDRQLAHSNFLLGNSFSLADAACFHPVWFLRAEPTAFSHAQKFSNLMRWFERIDAMGYGDVKPMDPDEALKIARDASPATPTNVQPAEPDTIAAGAQVSVTPDDYGF